MNQIDLQSCRTSKLSVKRLVVARSMFVFRNERREGRQAGDGIWSERGSIRMSDRQGMYGFIGTR